MLKPKYYVSKNDEFIIKNYNSSPTFSSFFPGIGGAFGTPMWVFYANRGQCIASFGIYDKDGSIMEFQPANKAYKEVALQGFRTFIKIDGKYWEPFTEISDDPTKMIITPHDLKLIDENKKLGVRVEVRYFTFPNEDFAALARTVKITNISKKSHRIEVVDGMPSIIPFGFTNSLLKNLSRTTEAWCIVENLEKGVPYYKLKVIPSDVPETVTFTKGNFYISFSCLEEKESAVKFIVNPRSVFGQLSDLELPMNFLNKTFNPPAKESKEGFIPSAFTFKRSPVGPGGALEIFTLIGHAESADEANAIKARVSKKKYFEKKSAENRELIDGITSYIDTSSAIKSFDLYARQTFLDNVMRGGLPINLGNRPIYCFYRKHGDMERDYNDFKVIPSYLSQGNGNYRDINQNRRNDVFFNPSSGDSNILRFFNLLQLDGYNPLVVVPSLYSIEPAGAARSLLKKHLKQSTDDLVDVLTKPYIIGVFLRSLEESGFEWKTSRESFAAELLEKSRKIESAEHGEGFWTDHFSYNLDLLESYEAVFPENMDDIIFKDKVFTFYDNDRIVCGRKDKYFLKENNVRQVNSVVIDKEKTALISGRSPDPNVVRDLNGQGKVYRCSLAAKMLCVIANKAASFDPEGIGIEMEAGKPDWYDALNGLPALFGSSISETLELKRFAAYLLEHAKDNVRFDIPVEIKELLDGVSSEVQEWKKTSDDFGYWDNTCALKEEYRKKTRLGVTGEEAVVDGKYIKSVLNTVIERCDAGIKKCLKKYGTYYTYFTHEAVDYAPINGTGNVKVKKFVQKPLPLFLEGFVHALKVEKDKKIYSIVKASQLYDKKLKMYKVNAPLGDVSIEIGRAKVFAPGWLENGSVWLHMEYKYLLELLKAGMYKEFFSDMKSVLIPFMDPSVYKRSILENSSFLVSSENPDKEDHGRGFVARLSGATAEFIDMWIRMTTGKNIFGLDKAGKLTFKLSPILPSWMFRNGKFSFKLLGSIDITYLNKKKKNTFDGLKPVSYLLTVNGKEVSVDGPILSEPYSRQVRDLKVQKIIVTLG